MAHKGFSHIGLSTRDLDSTRDFYESTAARHGLCVEEVGTLGSLGDPAGVGANEMMLRFTHAPAAPLHTRA